MDANSSCDGLTIAERQQLRDDDRFDDARRATIDTLRKLPTLDFARDAKRRHPDPCRCPEYVLRATAQESRRISLEAKFPIRGTMRCPCGEMFVTVVGDQGEYVTEPMRHYNVDEDPQHHRLVDAWLAKIGPWLRSYPERRQDRQLDRLIETCQDYLDQVAEHLGNAYRQFIRSQAWETLPASARWYFRAQHAIAQDQTWGGPTFIFTHEIARETIVALGGPRYRSLRTFTQARVALEKAGAYEAVEVGKSYKDGGGASRFTLPTAEHYCGEVGCGQCRYPTTEELQVNKPFTAAGGRAYLLGSSTWLEVPVLTPDARAQVQERIASLRQGKREYLETRPAVAETPETVEVQKPQPEQGSAVEGIWYCKRGIHRLRVEGVDTEHIQYRTEPDGTRVGDCGPCNGLSCPQGHTGDSIVSLPRIDGGWAPACVSCLAHGLADEAARWSPEAAG